MVRVMNEVEARFTSIERLHHYEKVNVLLLKQLHFLKLDIYAVTKKNISLYVYKQVIFHEDE